ncbi:tail assembly chaperone protein [Pseudomonas phage EM]|uniref:Tail assembly chaperone protein n=1 Tax=Pseudomonas phage EM TaxID=2936914 RepID=A0AAE9HK98_9CAUD|nr:tail assembly chaperone protein [Pseudomonas phage EM]UPW35876.1 tail assembly chaperone protein [Pseudomonas phage EM]
MFGNQRTVIHNGTEYTINLLPATRGISVLKQLTSLLGPSLAKYQADSDFAGAMKELFDNIDKVPVENLIQNLMLTVFKGSMAINFDTEFAGKYDLLYALTKDVIEFNFGSVFSLIGFAEAPTV